jgi:hypothetical protein
MPQKTSVYRVELQDGQVFDVEVEGDQPPTEQELLAHLEAQRSPGAAVPKALENAPPVSAMGEPGQRGDQGTAAWMGANFLQRLLPSTTLSDYWKGPLYAAQHPIDSLGLLGGAIKDAHVAEAGKTSEAASRFMNAPTLTQRLLAGSEVLGHGAATVVPFFGPAAAQVGEQIGSGDVAGGVGGAAGLLTPFAVRPGLNVAAKATAPARAFVSDRLATSANAQMGRALAATTNENKVRAARVAPEMVKRRITGGLKHLEERAAAEAETAGQAVGAAVKAVANKETDVLPLVEQLEEAKAPHLDTNSAGQRVVIEPAAVKAVNDLQAVLMDYGDKISIESLNKVRKSWDATVQRGKGFTADDVSQMKVWAAREGRSVLREELSKASPDIDRVMAEFSFWRNVEDIAHATNTRRVGQSGSLTPTIAGGAGALLAEGLVPGSGIAMKLGAGAVAAKLAASLRRALSSPGFQMWSAVQKGRLADALMSGDPAAVDAIVKAAATASATQTTTRAFPVGQSSTPDAQQARRQRFVGVTGSRSR